MNARNKMNTSINMNEESLGRKRLDLEGRYKSMTLDHDDPIKGDISYIGHDLNRTANRKSEVYYNEGNNILQRDWDDIIEQDESDADNSNISKGIYSTYTHKPLTTRNQDLNKKNSIKDTFQKFNSLSNQGIVTNQSRNTNRHSDRPLLFLTNNLPSKKKDINSLDLKYSSRTIEDINDLYKEDKTYQSNLERIDEESVLVAGNDFYNKQGLYNTGSLISSKPITSRPIVQKNKPVSVVFNVYNTNNTNTTINLNSKDLRGGLDCLDSARVKHDGVKSKKVIHRPSVSSVYNKVESNKGGVKGFKSEASKRFGIGEQDKKVDSIKSQVNKGLHIRKYTTLNQGETVNFRNWKK